MLKKDALIKETELMDALNNVFRESGYDPERSKDENSISDLLIFDFNAGINDEPVVAQHFFLPIHDEDITESYFVQSLTVCDEIEGDEKKLEMLQAIAVLNFNIPYGSFIFDTDIDILSYRYTVPVHESMKEADAEKMLINQVFMGFGIVSIYLPVINAFLEGRINWDEYLISLAEIVGEEA